MTDWLKKIDDQDNAGAAVVTTRELDTAFVPSATKYTFVSYTINQVAANDQDGTVTLLCDAANPPTTARTSARLAPSDPGAATPAVITHQQLTFIVPPGHYVKLLVAGTGTPTISQQAEIPMG